MAITRAQQARQMLKEGTKKPAMQGGGPNYLGKQPEVTVPRRWKSSPDHPDTELAYITEPEKKVLIALNMHGGLEDGKPNKGPKGVISLQGDMGSIGGGSGGSGGSGGGGGGNDDDRANLREQASVASTLGKKTPTMKEVREIVDRGPDDRGNFLQNRNQRNIVKYNQDLKKIEQNKNLNFIEKFNAKKRLKNKRFLDNRFTQKAQGIADYYGLSVGQLEDLLDAYDRDDFDLSDFRSIVDAGAPPSIISSDPNFLRAQELALSKGMAKGNKLSTGALFSTTDPTTRIDLPSPLLQKLQGDPNFSNLLSGLNRLKSLDKIASIPGGPTQKDVDNYFNLTMGKGGIDPLTGDPVKALFTPKDDDGPSDPCLGPNPPAYCFIGKKADDTMAAAPPIVPMFRFMNRGGMVEDAPMGTGIMDLESARQMMFIGGVAKAIGKGLKSATRAAKKVFKSPFGKAALFAAPFVMGGGGTGMLSGLKGKLLGLKGVEEFGGKAGLLKDLGLIKGGFGDFGGLTAGGIGSLFGLTSLLAALQKPKEDENFNLDNYYEKEGLRDFIASLGQRNRFLAEGGKAEPVAKKTMPLLDLDGQEMDFRAEGGFVPIGRMEKADDVPARLSKNEFVFTAEAVRNAGDGDVDKGAEVMYNTMKNLEAGGTMSEESQGQDGAKEMFQTAQRLEGVM
jgi:hypothetical protein